ncbi:MAG: 2-amino-4-hydroxy-6-hydroxymethyldihydropteridine diphosphokinase [Armatimonadota bacterium]|nr:2-amino-4-hydroxy-6-hydroxymethyldihydropteridine diphosphokinase [bacterium]
MPMETKTAYLSLGANIGDKAANLREAIELIDANEAGSVSQISSFYETSPVGLVDQPDFVNAAIRIETTLDPFALLALCNRIEQKLGRERTIRWGPRVIDIDILLYEGVNISEERLTIPHPRMMERGFVLVPLAEIAPDLTLPGGLTASEAASRIDATGVTNLKQ